MEIKVTLEIAFSEDAKSFLSSLLDRKPTKKAIATKEAPVKAEEAVKAEEPAPTEEKAPESVKEANPTATAVEARAAVNDARNRGISPEAIKGLLPKYGVAKVSDLNAEDCYRFIKEVEAL